MIIQKMEGLIILFTEIMVFFFRLKVRNINVATIFLKEKDESSNYFLRAQLDGDDRYETENMHVT